MKLKVAISISLGLALSLACVSIFAQATNEDSKVKLLPPLTPVASMDMAQQKNVQRTVPGAYRLTYTLTDIEGTKRVGSQRYQVTLDADAQPARVDLRATVPVPLGNTGGAFSREDAQLSIFARLRQFANGMELNTEIHQTVFAGGTNGQAATNSLPPITRHNRLSTTVLLIENKAVTIGELDIPGSMHSLQVQVELTRVH